MAYENKKNIQTLAEPEPSDQEQNAARPAQEHEDRPVNTSHCLDEEPETWIDTVIEPKIERLRRKLEEMEARAAWDEYL